MTEQISQEVLNSIASFHLPRYHELPDMGLYLEQVVRYVNRCIGVNGSGGQITSSMVSNYVKAQIIPGPRKKTYGADSIAYLIFVAYVKAVMSLEDIRIFEQLQKHTYELSVAYNYFCEELENLLQYVYGLKPAPDTVGSNNSAEKELLRSALLSIAHKIYLDHRLAELRSRSRELI